MEQDSSPLESSENRAERTNEEHLERLSNQTKRFSPVIIQIGVNDDQSTLDAILDSGAEVSAMSEEVFNWIQANQKEGKYFRVVEEACNVVLKTANNQQVKVLKRVYMEFRVGKPRFSTWALFHVVPKLTRGIILGVPLIYEWSPRFLLKADQVILHPANHPAVVVSCASSGSKLAITFICGETIEIPARSAKYVKIIYENPKHQLFGEGEVSEVGNYKLPEHVAIGSNIMPANQQEILITNFGNTPAVIRRGKPLGVFIPALQEVGVLATLADVEEVADQELSVEVNMEIDPIPKDMPKSEEEVMRLIDEKLAKNPNLTEEQRQNLRKVVFKHVGVFIVQLENPGSAKVEPISVEIKGDPIRQRPRVLPRYLEELSETEIRKLLELGFIQRSKSPWASPIVAVPKRDGTVRICIDYRKINQAMKKDVYPLPLQEELTNAAHGAAWFSTFDCASGYYQFPLERNTAEKLAFITTKGLYEFKVLPMGISNAPSIFQRTMDVILSGLAWHCCCVYLDDILVFSKTFEEHLLHLDMLFTRLAEHKIYLKISKSNFCMHEVKYLGHILSRNGIRPNPEKIKEVMDCKPPTDQASLRRFLGLANYYHKFIHMYSTHAAELTPLLKKGSTWNWDDRKQKAFEALKTALAKEPVLTLPDFTKAFILKTDASNHAIGAILCQQYTDGERVIAYGSRTLQGPERNYLYVGEKEALACVHFTKHFKHYLHGQRFKLVTDHKALRHIATFKELDNRVGRWALYLCSQNLEVEYKPGSTHNDVDALTRPPFKYDTNRNQKSGEQVLLLGGKPLDSYAIINGDRQKMDNCVTTEINVITTDIGNETDHNADDNHFKFAEKFNMVEEQKKDEQIRILKQIMITKKIPLSLDLESQKYLALLSLQCELIDGVLYLNWWPQKRNIRDGTRRRLWVPQHRVGDLLFDYHDSLIAGHGGITQMDNALRNKFYWPTYYKDIYNYVRECRLCQERKNAKIPILLPMQPLVAKYPWELVEIDILGPLPQTGDGYQYVLVMIDWFTKYLEVKCLKQTTAEVIGKALLNKLFLRHGSIGTILSDNAKHFQNHFLQLLERKLGTTVKFSSAHRAASHGLVEVTIKEIRTKLAKYIEMNHGNWKEYINFISTSL